jgi:hypothetical protein
MEVPEFSFSGATSRSSKRIGVEAEQEKAGIALF